MQADDDDHPNDIKGSGNLYWSRWQVRPGEPATRSETIMSDLKATTIELDRAFKDHDEDKLRQLMTGDHVAIIAGHGEPLTNAAFVGRHTEYDLTSFETSDVAETMLSPDVTLITYHVSQSGSYAGNPLPAKAFASEIWVKNAGQWRQRLFQTTALTG